MARATRSSTQQHDIVIAAPTSRTTKKRKRTSTADTDDHPVTKQPRPDAAINGDVDESNAPQDHGKLPQFQNAGDLPIDARDAQKILDILEMIDTQGLLDRIFPLPLNSSESSSRTKSSSHSFRTLLKESSQHPLCVLRSAVQHLLPISSHPRSRPSTPAAQQLRFCDLALSLLDQASFHSVHIPPDLESILPLTSVKEETDDTKPIPSTTIEASPSLVARKRRYALMQKLSTGDYWTSLNSDSSTDLKDLPIGYAELVAVLPSTAPSLSSSSTLPTLGSYKAKKPLTPRPKLPQPRQVSCGAFLDYGPYTSFAPSFDQAGVEIGRTQLGEVIWGWEGRKRARKAVVEPPKGDEFDMGVVEVEGISQKRVVSVEEALDGLLSIEQIEGIKSTLGSLELEAAVLELLERNRRALERLEELQATRLASEGSTSEVEVGSEEWDIAQGIMDSLSLLASLRPRSSGEKNPTLIPPASVLHKLYRTLPLEPTPGWYGTLPPSRATSLRDDSTIYIKAGTTIPAVAPAATPAPANATTTATAQAYPGYNYSPYASQQFRGAYTPYKTGQPASSYYPGFTAAVAQGQGQQQQSAPQSQTFPQPYYGAQFGSSGAQQYTYGSWYNYQTATGGASTNGRGTPQPTTGASTPSTSIPTNYAGFFSSSTQPPQRAVANTVTANKPWGGTGVSNSNAAGYAPPTLPAHLRSTATATPQPGTPGGYQPGSYYGSYAPNAAR